MNTVGDGHVRQHFIFNALFWVFEFAVVGLQLQVFIRFFFLLFIFSNSIYKAKPCGCHIPPSCVCVYAFYSFHCFSSLLQHQKLGLLLANNFFTTRNIGNIEEPFRKDIGFLKPKMENDGVERLGHGVEMRTKEEEEHS